MATLRADKFVFLVDSAIMSTHALGLIEALRRFAAVETISIAPDERTKSLHLVQELLERVLQGGLSRRSCMVSFGGGMVANLSGLVAALAFRGIRLVHLPTTLVAAADGVISLKQAVNASVGKNLIGTFHAPAAVFVDVRWLRSLPQREWRSGLCELVKNALAADPDSRAALAERITAVPAEDRVIAELVQSGIRTKSKVMAKDPHERTSGLIFEYGHTVGHAIELASAGGLSHGESIGLGMLCAADVARRLVGLSEKAYESHVELLALCGVTRQVGSSISASEVASRLMFDNKRGYLPITSGEVPMVLLRELGQPNVTDGIPLTGVPAEVVASVILSGRAVRFA
jgi:3-dehydroquinate synthase/2-deoxy-scyllo-inosose synthase